MGTSHSSPRLQVPLCPQPTPFLATNNGRFTETLTTLRIKASIIGNSVKVFDTASNNLIYRFKSALLTSRQRLLAPDGRVLMSIKSPMLANGERIYEGDQTETECFRIDFQSKPSLIYTQFYDTLSGELCRVVVNGKSSDRVVNVYLERGYSAPLPVYELNTGDFMPFAVEALTTQLVNRFQAVGRIRMPYVYLASGDEYFVDAVPGIDVTLVLLLWAVRYRMETQRRQTPAPRKRRYYF